MVTRGDYPGDGVTAACSVLLELGHLLGEYREHIVVVGGWVPELLLATPESPHIGSLDVDLALDHRSLQAVGYRTIHELLLAQGYYQKQSDQPFRYYRNVVVETQEIVVEVDFLAGEYEGTGRGHRHQKVQGVQPRKARGCDLAVDLSSEVVISGVLPSGAADSTAIRVAHVVAFVAMKGIALGNRMKEKDAWDVDFCLRNYPGGLDALADAFRPHLNNGLMREGLRSLAAKFDSPTSYGPVSIADFEELEDPDERALRQRDSFERVQYLLERVEIR